jgi:DNA-directed RNA polymerase specialized sigma subunit
MATVAEVKADLNAIRGAQERLNRRLERIQVLRSQIERITPILSDMPKGGGEIDRRGKMLAELVDISREYEQSCIEQQRIILNGLKLIDSLKNDTERAILEDYYIDGKSWQTIADKRGYAYSTVTNLHGVALQKLAESKK